MIGGQHISAAIHSVYLEKVEKGYPESNIENSLKYVNAELLRADCPVQLARRAAGQHQQRQLATRALNTEDAIHMFRREARKKVDVQMEWQLTDNEIWLALQSMGMAKDIPRMVATPTKTVEVVKVRPPPCAAIPLMYAPQREYYLKIWRPLGYLTALAVHIGLDDRFQARVREMNGEFATEATERFKSHLIKEYSTGLSISDFCAFLDWFCGPSLAAVGTPKKIQAKLTELRHWRLARLHVFCPDGRVPEGKSMPR